MKVLKLVQKVCVENKYSGHGWNFEKTTKYVFRLDDMLLEVGYFEHYLNLSQKDREKILSLNIKKLLKILLLQNV